MANVAGLESKIYSSVDKSAGSCYNRRMDTYCHHPWLGLEITPQSEFLVCCKWQGSRPATWQEYHNSPDIQRVRQQMLAGQRAPECIRCWQEEDAGLLSKRLLDRSYRFQGLPWEQKPLKQVSVAFGNTCNLACRICDSHSSSRWYAEAKEFKKTYPSFMLKPHNKFYQQPEFMSELKRMTTDVRTVEFFGGEPFVSGIDEQVDLLEHLTQHGPEHIVLDYQTNGTTWPDSRLQQLWPKFKQVNIAFSLDGTGSVFEYNRHPANWSQVEQHVLRWRDICAGHKSYTISVTCTISIFTITGLEDFIKWCLRNSLPLPHLNILYDPYYYDSRMLPSAAKQHIGRSNIVPENIKNWLMSADMSQHIPKFREIVSMQDAMRNENFATVFPTLHNFLEEYYA